MDPAAPVCVVGAGQSGVFAAATLRGLGFTNIDILEAGPRLGGYCQTYEAEGEIYDFQAHLVAQQDFGVDMTGTAIDELLTAHPVPTHPESLHFVSRSASGKPQPGVPAHFVPLFATLTPEQLVDQLGTAWALIEHAVRDRTGPTPDGLAFDRIAGETWESYRARHAPLVGEILQGLTLYANLRRPRQPAETVVNANAHICGHVSQLAKLILSLYPARRDELLDRMPRSLVAQLSSRRPIALAFSRGFISLLDRIIDDLRLRVLVDSRVHGIEPLGPDEIRVHYTCAGARRSGVYARVLITARPAQIREIFPTGEVRELFAERNCPRAWTRSYLLRVREELIEFRRRPDSPEPLGFWLIEPYGGYTDTDPDQALHRITAANKQHPGPYWVCFSNSDLSISDARAWELARQDLYLFDDPELIAETIAEWPAYPSAAAIRDGWFDRVAAIQGRHGVYFAGEILSGPTAECISAYIREVIPRWFGGEAGD